MLFQVVWTADVKELRLIENLECLGDVDPMSAMFNLGCVIISELNFYISSTIIW